MREELHLEHDIDVVLTEPESATPENHADAGFDGQGEAIEVAAGPSGDGGSAVSTDERADIGTAGDDIEE